MSGSGLRAHDTTTLRSSPPSSFSSVGALGSTARRKGMGSADTRWGAPRQSTAQYVAEAVTT